MAAAEKGSLMRLDHTRKATAKSLFQGTLNVRAMANELFKMMDVSGRGALTQDEIIVGLVDINPAFGEDDLEKTFKHGNYDFEQFWVHFSKFLRSHGAMFGGGSNGPSKAPVVPPLSFGSLSPAGSPATSPRGLAPIVEKRSRIPGSARRNTSTNNLDNVNEDSDAVAPGSPGSPGSPETSSPALAPPRRVPVMLGQMDRTQSKRMLSTPHMMEKPKQKAKELFATLGKMTLGDMASQLFHTLDVDNDGYLEKDELKQVLLEMGGFNESQIDAVFNELDGNGDGKVT